MDSGVSVEMPRYRCHKEVHALKIRSVEVPMMKDGHGPGRILSFVDEIYAPVHVGMTYFHKHDPQPGGYYVVYKDGYQSFSPAKAFEEGYTRI